MFSSVADQMILLCVVVVVTAAVFKSVFKASSVKTATVDRSSDQARMAT